MAVVSRDNFSSPWSITSPFNNNTNALHTVVAPGWVSSPDVRGTMDIIQSCALTLVACIYTALHLNVPTNCAWYAVLWTKTKWAAMALVAPEFVLFMAIDQFQQAFRLKSKLRQLQQNSKGKNENFDIDLKYAFFVVMGGIRLKIDDILSVPDLNPGAFEFDPSGRPSHPTARLSPQGMIRLAERGHWVPVARSKINDKSKADYFQKILVVIQALWLVVQCITRKYYNLPLTLLEVHTMTHVACATCLYICWLKKPLDIQDPEVLVPSACKFEGEIALMVQQQFYSQWAHYLALLPPRGAPSESPPWGRCWITLESDTVLGIGHVTTTGLAVIRSDASCEDLSLEVTSKFVERWNRIFRTFSFTELTSLPRKPVRSPLDGDEEQASQSLTQGGMGLFLYQLKHFANHEDSSPRLMPFNEDESNFNVKTDAEAGALVLLITLLSALYGGLHLIAWNWNFPTEVEYMLWRVSCSLVAGAYPLFLIVFGIFVAPFVFCIDALEKYQETIIGWSWLMMMAVSVVARIYIVVEAFASLRLAPVGVYLSPDWLQMFPHA